MQIPMIGTVSSYIRTMTLENKWQEKKKNLAQAGRQEDSQLAAYRKQVADLRKSQSISIIEGKMKAGLALSGAELEYLRKNSPGLYEKAIAIQKEREEYRKELKRCRTKEDVERLKTNKMQQYVSQAQAVSNNSAIPLDKKLEKLEEINMRVMAIQNEHVSFTQSDQYASLPDNWEDEKRKKRKPKEKISMDDNDVRREIERLRLKLSEPAKIAGNTQASSDAGHGDSSEPDTTAQPEQDSGAGYIYTASGKPDENYAGAGKASDTAPRISVEI